jgi:hypothetical protein
MRLGAQSEVASACSPNATRIGLQESMRKYDESRKSCTRVAQNAGVKDEEGRTNEGPDESEVPIPSDLLSGGADETRTRDLRRDRHEFTYFKSSA